MKFPIWLLWTFVTRLDGPKNPNSFVFRCSNATQWYGTGISVRHWSKATAIGSILYSLPLCCSYLPLIANRPPKSLFSPLLKQQSRHGSDMVSYALCQPLFYVITSCVRPALISAQSCYCLLLLIYHLPISCTQQNQYPSWKSLKGPFYI